MNREKLTNLHLQEDAANRQIGDINKRIGFMEERIKHLKKKKIKVAYFISNNMKYRNKLIKE